jgi:hypothetical protein
MAIQKLECILKVIAPKGAIGGGAAGEIGLRREEGAQISLVNKSQASIAPIGLKKARALLEEGTAEKKERSKRSFTFLLFSGFLVQKPNK